MEPSTPSYDVSWMRSVVITVAKFKVSNSVASLGESSPFNR